MRGRLLALWVVGCLAPAATAAPAARQRVVLADADPELRHAMEQALAPWHLEVVVDGAPPADLAIARQQADTDTARFVVWRDGDQLVVYDRERELIERRASRAGVLDAPAAAGAALTIKTMMRLPPPPAAPIAGVAQDAATQGSLARTGVEVRGQLGVSTRIARGDATAVSARFAAVVALRPWPTSHWRFGLAGDGGTSTSVSRASFKGAWREWSLAAVVSWTYVHAAWELEPHAGTGVRRSTLDGTEMTTARREAAILATARAGVWVRRRYLRWSFGVALGVDETFQNPTYTKTGTPAEIFQVPGVAAELGIVIAVDL